MRKTQHCNVTICLKLRKDKVVLVYAVRPYRGVEGLLHSFLIFYTVHAPAALLLKATRFQLGGPQSNSGCFGKEKELIPL